MSNPLFPQRSWPGLTSWLLTVLGSVAVFEFLAMLAWRNQEGRLLDLTTAVVTIPAGAILLLFLAALIWTIAGKTPLLPALGWSARLAPFAWAIPIFDLIRTYGNGLVLGPPKLNGLDLLSAIGTAGMLPITSGISIGIRLGIFAAAVGVGMVAWTLTKKIWKAVVSGLVMSAATVKLMSTVSLLALWKSPFAAESWTALPFEITRRATIVLSKGYWWSRLYERFPTAVDAQADVAARLAESAFVITALGIVLIFAFLLLLPKRRSILQHVYHAWTSFDIALYAAFGLLFAFVRNVSAAGGGFDVMASVLFILVLIAFRFSTVLRRDLSRLEANERDGVSQPILRGELTVEGAKALALIGELYALFASWVLGWPVFACALVFLSASFLTRSKLWVGVARAATIFRAVGAGAVALLALFFVTQDAKVTTTALTVVVLAALHRIVIELFWMNRMKN